MSNNNEDGLEGMDLESVVSAISDMEPENPQDPPAEEDTKTKPVEDSAQDVVEDTDVDDEIDSIVNDLSDDEDSEAGDSPEEEEETEEETSDKSDDAQETFKYTVDGEEHELSAKELHELRKDAGRSKSLTQKEQAIAETRKQLEAEAKAVEYAKLKPEVRSLMDEIQIAEEAIARGFIFDEDGAQTPLSKTQVENTQKNVAEARAKLGEMQTPPMLDELQDAVPGLFSSNPDEVAEAAAPYESLLRERGYSQL